ncbi:MAG: glycosyltransferase family A protein [Ignavibacteriaceae bacterium]
MLPEAVENYLSKYALRGWEIESATLKNISTAIIVPAIREYENIKRLLISLADNDQKFFNSTLVIFVINNSALSSAQIKEDNGKSIYLLNSIIGNNFADNADLINKVRVSGLNIGFVDAASAGKELPQKDAGVGLARKIGMDLALLIFDYDPPGKKILVCLDADCTVESNYITEIVNHFNTHDSSAAAVDYVHKTDGSEEEVNAIICYEIFLRYYELGLKYAGSPFAFPTIGSTMICDYQSYIKTEGMNKRKAAEDFYFLEKLAKNYPVKMIRTTTVYPSSRRSWRVPFGTGQRVNRFLAHVQDEYVLYNPKSFFILKEWLKIFNNETQYLSTSLLKSAKDIDYNLFMFLYKQGFEIDWQRILDNSKTKEQIQRQKIRWFDGFRTLKLIHFLRENGYPMINMFEALDSLLGKFNTGIPPSDLPSDKRTSNNIPGIEIQRIYLKLLRTQLQN